MYFLMISKQSWLRIFHWNIFDGRCSSHKLEIFHAKISVMGVFFLFFIGKIQNTAFCFILFHVSSTLMCVSLSCHGASRELEFGCPIFFSTGWTPSWNYSSHGTDCFETVSTEFLFEILCLYKPENSAETSMIPSG